jgi:hypothetical protein
MHITVRASSARLKPWLCVHVDRTDVSVLTPLHRVWRPAALHTRMYAPPQGRLPYRTKEETTHMRVTERATVVCSRRVLQIRARDGYDGLRLARCPDSHTGSCQANIS